jgi:hypothetical protein
MLVVVTNKSLLAGVSNWQVPAAWLFLLVALPTLRVPESSAFGS